MELTKIFTLRRKFGFLMAGNKYGNNVNNNGATFCEGLGSFIFLNFAALVNMDVCRTTKCGNVSRALYIISEPLDENGIYEAISNFEKGGKTNFVSSMASRSTVSLKLFASKRCFLVCQQNLVVKLYSDSATNFVAIPKSTVKLQTVKCGSSIENLLISFTLSWFEKLYLCDSTFYTDVQRLKRKVKDSSICKCN